MTEKDYVHMGTMTILLHEVSFRCRIKEADRHRAHVVDHAKGRQALEKMIYADAEEAITNGSDCGAFAYEYRDSVHLDSVSVECAWEIALLETPGEGAMTIRVTDNRGRTVDLIHLRSAETVRVFLSLITQGGAASVDKVLNEAREALGHLVAAGNHLIAQARKGEG